MTEQDDSQINNDSLEITPELVDKLKKLMVREEKKNAYNREYMRKLREDKVAYNKSQRELYHKRKAKQLATAS